MVGEEFERRRCLALGRSRCRREDCTVLDSQRWPRRWRCLLDRDHLRQRLANRVRLTMDGHKPIGGGRLRILWRERRLRHAVESLRRVR